MSLATLETFVKQFLEFQSNEASIVFQGGEPLLRNIAFYEKAIDFQTLGTGMLYCFNCILLSLTYLSP